jgi:hypothetical protein
MPFLTPPMNLFVDAPGIVVTSRTLYPMSHGCSKIIAMNVMHGLTNLARCGGSGRPIIQVS